MPEPADRIHFIADRGDARLRLDQVLVRRVTGITRMSRTVAQRWIESGAIAVDGRVNRRPASRVREGAAVEVTLPHTAVRRATPQPEAGDLQILYEDACLVAINKPPGVVVHPSYKQLSGTLLNALLWRIRDRPGARPGILTRLDKGTSGIVIVALSADVHATMQRDAAAGDISKEYLAIVSGAPAPRTGTIRAPLGRDPQDRRRMMVLDGGAESVTRYDVVARLERVSLVRCQLVTGRTHQIRVHLASRGWPILGDAVYGTADSRIPRQALHAWRVTLPHPVTREPLTIVAPIAEDMRSAAVACGLRMPGAAETETSLRDLRK
jgi:23S rRNA pseudouridine1911/1915/1917 synthase